MLHKFCLQHQFVLDVYKNVTKKLSSYLQINKAFIPTVDIINNFQFTNGLRKNSNFSNSSIPIAKYEEIANDTLESLYDCVEEAVENNTRIEDTDITLSDGILTIKFGKLFGTYVINKQTPNKQLWLSSPISGPKRYDFIVARQCWIYYHDNRTIHQLLQEELSQILNQTIDLSKCKYSEDHDHS